MKLFFAFTMLATTFAASAQRFPRIPRVNIGRPCRVLMIDNWHRPVATYYGRVDVFSGQCAKPMSECRNDLYAQGSGRGHDRDPRDPRRPGPGPRHGRELRCVDENGRW
jgi:hypothetical protein